jgi:hypothetical protein
LPATEEIENRATNTTCRLFAGDFDITNDGVFSASFFWRFRMSVKCSAKKFGFSASRAAAGDGSAVGDSRRAITTTGGAAAVLTAEQRQGQCVD